MKKQAVLSLSGGMDSSTLLLRLLADGYEVTALSFDYGQKHSVELERAESLVRYLNKQLPALGYPVVKYQVIKLDGLSQLLNSALVTGVRMFRKDITLKRIKKQLLYLIGIKSLVQSFRQLHYR